MGNVEVQPGAAHEPRGRDVARARCRIRPHPLRGFERDLGRAVQPVPELAGEPGRRHDVELLTGKHRVRRHDERERDSVGALGGRRRVDQGVRQGCERGRPPRGPTVDRHHDRVGRDADPALPRVHGADHERSDFSRAQLQLPHGRADRRARAPDADVGELVGAQDQEAGKGRQLQADRFRRAGARPHGEPDLVAEHDPTAVHARRDVERRGAHLQREQHHQGRRHQSFTPGSSARRTRPVRLLRVASSSWPIERRI